MVDRNLVDYIEKFIHSGGSVHQAKEKLVKAGHHHIKVEEAASKVKQKKFREVGLVILGIVIIISVLGLILSSLVKDEPEVFIPSHQSLVDAVKAGDISACDRFDSVQRDICRKSILGELSGGNKPKALVQEDIVELATKTKNPSLCEQIINEDQKQRCLLLSGGIEPLPTETPTSTIYNAETNQVEVVEYQYIVDITDEAESTGDSTGCNQIINPVQRQNCLVLSS